MPEDAYPRTINLSKQYIHSGRFFGPGLSEIPDEKTFKDLELRETKGVSMNRSRFAPITPPAPAPEDTRTQKEKDEAEAEHKRSQQKPVGGGTSGPQHAKR